MRTKRVVCESWASALVDSADAVTDFHDIREEFEKNDLRERVAELEAFLRQAYDDDHSMRVKNKGLQGENERLRAELLAAKAADKAAKLVEAKLVEDLEGVLSCPISLGLFNDPVVSTESGHTYEREDIEKWLQAEECCPVTKFRMTRKHLVSNYTLAGVVDAFKAYQAQQAQ